MLWLGLLKQTPIHANAPQQVHGTIGSGCRLGNEPERAVLPEGGALGLEPLNGQLLAGSEGRGAALAELTDVIFQTSPNDVHPKR
jgi:hypothetical protein